MEVRTNCVILQQLTDDLQPASVNVHVRSYVRLFIGRVWRTSYPRIGRPISGKQPGGKRPARRGKATSFGYAPSLIRFAHSHVRESRLSKPTDRNVRRKTAGSYLIPIHDRDSSISLSPADNVRTVALDDARYCTRAL